MLDLNTNATLAKLVAKIRPKKRKQTLMIHILKNDKKNVCDTVEKTSNRWKVQILVINIVDMMAIMNQMINLIHRWKKLYLLLKMVVRRLLSKKEKLLMSFLGLFKMDIILLCICINFMYGYSCHLYSNVLLCFCCLLIYCVRLWCAYFI